jgi:AAA15 family ATPase/GTPase
MDGLLLSLPDGNHSIDTKVFLIPARSIIHPTIHCRWFDKIQLEGNKNILLNFIKEIYSDIEDIFVINHSGIPCIACKNALTPPLPINVISSGLNSLIILLLCVLANPNSIILVDEIENGFHHSFLLSLYDIIFKISLEYNCQLFFTTHSYECLSNAVDSLQKFDLDIFSYFRFDNFNGAIKSTFYPRDLLQSAIDLNFEVR